MKKESKDETKREDEEEKEKVPLKLFGKKKGGRVGFRRSMDDGDGVRR